MTSRLFSDSVEMLSRNKADNRCDTRFN